MVDICSKIHFSQVFSIVHEAKKSRTCAIIQIDFKSISEKTCTSHAQMQLGPLSFLTSVFSVISVDNLGKKNYSDQIHPPPCTKRLVGKYS